MHNPNIILLGSHGSTDLSATEELGTVEAGLVTHRKSDGSVSILSSDGQVIGVSLGETLDGDTTKSSIARNGNLIPVQVTPEATRIGNVDYIAKVQGVSVVIVAGGTAGAEVVTVTDKKISVQIQAATSTATQVAAAVNASAPAMELLASSIIQSGQGATAQAAVAETAVPINSTVVLGAAFKFSATTGKGISTGTTSGAFYVSDVKIGQKRDGTQVFAAYIDMAGGL